RAEEPAHENAITGVIRLAVPIDLVLGEDLLDIVAHRVAHPFVHVADQVISALRAHALREEAGGREIAGLLGEPRVIESVVVAPLPGVAAEELLEQVGLRGVAFIGLAPVAIRERPALGAPARAHPFFAAAEPLSDGLARGLRDGAADVRLRIDVLLAPR